MNRIILTKTVKNNNTYTVYALMDENGNYKDFQLSLIHISEPTRH